jgi:LuxR family transcriptional regulator, maltose regulon positive regulatory protein
LSLRSGPNPQHRPRLGALVAEVSALRDLITSGPVMSAGASQWTPAELRLLPYMQTHLRVREIGERWFVSHNTGNSQFRSIYRKLDATSRGEAVARATAIGLLGN